MHILDRQDTGQRVLGVIRCHVTSLQEWRQFLVSLERSLAHESYIYTAASTNKKNLIINASKIDEEQRKSCYLPVTEMV